MAANFLMGAARAADAMLGGNGARPVTVEQQIKSLAAEVSGKMGARENAARHRKRPTCCGLYLHFFLSIFAAAECAVRLVIHLAMLLVLGLSYYVVYCVSCGEWSAQMSGCLAHHSSQYGLYSGLLCGLTANICCPWNPPVCGFHIRGNTLARPSADFNRLHTVKIDFCCCCGSNNVFDIPQYKILQSFFFAFGGFSACKSVCMCCVVPGGCNGCCALTNNKDVAIVEEGQPLKGEGRLSAGYVGYMQSLLREVEEENAEDTRQFYQQEYQCSSFEELVQRRLGVQLPPPGQRQAAQNPGYIHPPQQQNMDRQQQQQPPVVYASAVSSSGQPVQGYALGQPVQNGKSAY